MLKTDPAAEPARAYLKSRDFPGALAEEFGLGYAPEGWDMTLKWAQKNGHSMQALEAGRLVATSDTGRTYDFFRGRLMIPIYNDAGEVVAFSGRLLDPEAKAQKYVNSQETPVFSKSKILFGLNKSKRAIIEAESAIVCEGQIDLMRCWQHGIRNIVASQGTAFTDHHARSLKRIAGKEVVICFDADRAGQNASLKSIDVLLKQDLQVRIARIPQGEDPDSLLRKKPVAFFETILREAKDYTRHLLDTACEQEDIASPRGRGAVAQQMAQVIAKIPNAVQREGFLLDVARRLQVPRSVLEEEVRKAEAQIRRSELQQRQYPGNEPANDAEEPGHAEGEPQEPILAAPIIEALLSLLLTNAELVPQVSRQLNPAWIEGLGGAEVLQQVLDAHAHDAFESATQFMEECDDRTRDYLAGLLLHPTPVSTETTPEAYADRLVRNFERRWKQQRLQFLTIAVKSSELSVEERMKYLMEIQVIRRQFPDLEP